MRLIISLLLAGLASTAWAQATKSIELEWEEVPNAVGYVIKLVNRAGGDPIYFTAKEAHISEQVPVGIYDLRIRSRAQDEDVYSPWSDPVALEVLVKELVPLSPSNQAVIEAKGSKLQAVEFSWSPIEKVKEYGLKIWNDDPNFKPLVFTTKTTKKSLTVKTGHQYFWQVSFETSNDTTYAQTPPTFSFTLAGEKLLPASDMKVIRVVDDQVLSWKAPPDVKTYTIRLSYRFLDETEFKFVREAKVETSPWNIGKLHPGAYKVEVVATAPNRTPSVPAPFEFIVKPTEIELGLR